MAASTDTEKRLQIRKYPNRRYYDSTRSQHLTLEQIYGLIREGYEIEVIDSKTGQDITAKVLAQIIIDLDAPKLGVFPVTMLHRLLQSNTEMVGHFVDRYFNQPLTAFMNSPWGMREYLRQASGQPNGPGAPADWAKLALGPFSPSFWTRPHADAKSDTLPTSEPSSNVHAEIESLRKQMASLESQFPPGRAAAPRRKRKK